MCALTCELGQESLSYPRRRFLRAGLAILSDISLRPEVPNNTNACECDEMIILCRMYIPSHALLHHTRCAAQVMCCACCACCCYQSYLRYIRYGTVVLARWGVVYMRDRAIRSVTRMERDITPSHHPTIHAHHQSRRITDSHTNKYTRVHVMTSIRMTACSAHMHVSITHMSLTHTEIAYTMTSTTCMCEIQGTPTMMV